jgi:hypothetical protein
MSDEEYEPPKNQPPVQLSPPDREAENTLRISVMRLLRQGYNKSQIHAIVRRSMGETY